MDQDQQNPDKNSLQEGQSDAQQPVITRVSGMYQDYFLDYASYVILERAVPALRDGLKPVQRRILHAMREMDDGRFHKVANIIGQTMKYHPHGDASIGDALVQLGQKNLLIDTQGNWGNTFTGDRSAAPRYIEARLTKFALEVGFNKKITPWQNSYDGRGQEPILLPVKFPLLLAQGIEGIAVGLSTKILPHNFNELIDASIAVLSNKPFELYPDFPTGGVADFSNYNEGAKGSRVRVRARIHIEDKKTLTIKEIPYGTTTVSVIDSILRANEKGKIKIKKIEDNTAEYVEIRVYLAPGISPDQMIDALYAFTDCEVSISPQACAIDEEKPLFLSVKDILTRSTENTKELLRQELQIKLDEYREQWHFASLERIFIENKIYRDIEEAESWEQVMAFIHKGLKPFIKHLVRDVTDADVIRLTEIRIKRISKYDKKRADDHILELEKNIEEIRHHLDNLVAYAKKWFRDLKKKYGKDRQRRTEIRAFEDIVATKVAIANEKLYVNRAEGFMGTALKKDEYVKDCSDLDNVITFTEEGKMMVTKVENKVYVGKGIIHINIWKRGDKRTVYNMIYRDGARGNTYMKRFSITSITRDKEYDLTAGTKGSKVLYFSANPNGEAEVVMVHLRALQRLKKLRFTVDFSELTVKGRGARGNTVTKNPVKKIELKEEGVSTLGARKIYFDPEVRRLNADGKGELLGYFKGNDKILEISASGHYRLLGYDLSTHFDEDLLLVEKFFAQKPVSAVYYDGEKQRHYVKRFIPERDSGNKELFISDHIDSKLEIATTFEKPQLEVYLKGVTDPEVVDLVSYISVKGEKAQGNQLVRENLKKLNLQTPIKNTSNESIEALEHKNDKGDDEDSQTTLKFD